MAPLCSELPGVHGPWSNPFLSEGRAILPTCHGADPALAVPPMRMLIGVFVCVSLLDRSQGLSTRMGPLQTFVSILVSGIRCG